LPIHVESKFGASVPCSLDGARQSDLRQSGSVALKGSLISGYRSRQISKSDLDRQSNFFGIPSPTRKGSLRARLESRKRYTEQLFQLLDPDSSTKGRYATNDIGHEFTSVKFHATRSPLLFTSTRVSSAYSRNFIGNVVPGSGHVYVPPSARSAFSDYGPTGTKEVKGFTITDVNPFMTSTSDKIASDNTDAFRLSVNDVNLVSSQYFNNTIPDPAKSGIGETVVDILRGDFPRLFTQFVDFAKQVSALGGPAYVRRALNKGGGSYLNTVFGWIPTISDVSALVRLLVGLDSLVYGGSTRRTRSSEPLHGYLVREYSGKPKQVPFIVRTPGMNFIPETSTTRPQPLASQPLVADYTWSTYQTVDYRFSARYNPRARPSSMSNGYLDKAHEFLRQTGVMSETFVWDLTPYSWLFDWFFDLGKVIQNVSAYTGTKSRWNVDYAYITFKLSIVEDAYLRRIEPNGKNDSVTLIGGNRLTTVSSVLHRRRATPFGFGMTLDSLSNSQVAILAALGLVKLT